MARKTIGVAGAGTMGNGIAHVSARSGLNVVLYDLEQRFLDRALSTISKNLDREVAKDKISAQDREASLARLTATVDLTALAEVDFFIEAATEDLDIKLNIFRQVSRLVHEVSILDGFIEVHFFVRLLGHALDQCFEVCLLLESFRLVAFMLLLPSVHGLDKQYHVRNVRVLLDR